MMVGLAVVFYVMALGGPVLGIPVYGTTRYGRPSTAVAPPPPSFYYRPARLYPYTDNYNDIYYRPVPVIHYPYYRPEDVYRSVHPVVYTPYYYGNEETYEPDDSIHDETSHLDGSSRSDALPVGQETWFEGDSNPSWKNYDESKAAFLQTLIMNQMYDDALEKSSSESVEDTDKNSLKDDSYEYKTQEYYGDRDTRDFEDEDVRELKALAGKPLYHVPKTSLQYPVNHNDASHRVQYWYHDDTTPKSMRVEDDQMFDDYPNDEGWINWDNKRSANPVKTETVKKTTTTFPTKKPVTSSTTVKPVAADRIPATVITLGGQKEEVLLRPATPARQPFPEPVLHMLETNNLNQSKRTPSVYDTIKRLLSMEESYKPNSENKGRMQKRFIATEDDLVGELKGLKIKRRSTA